MASLYSSSSNSRGAGAQITGPFQLNIDANDMKGGVMELQRAASDTDADYRTVDTYYGSGSWNIQNTGANYYRIRMYGCRATLGSPAKADYTQ